MANLRFSIAALLAAGGLAVALSGQHERGEYYLHATFTSLSGSSLTNLDPDEIRVSAGDRDLEITQILGPAEPFDIALVMDVSPSTEGEVDSIRSATSDFIDYFPLTDRFLILTFDDDVYVDCDWTTDRKKVDEAIWEFGLHKPGSSTILYEAIVMAVGQKMLDRRPRTVMVLFTDGVDTGSKSIKEEESIEYLQGLGVVPYIIQYFSLRHYQRLHDPAPERPDVTNLPPSTGGTLGGIFVGGGERDFAKYKIEQTRQQAVAYLRRLGDAGGGVFLPIVGVDELPKVYQKIAVELTDVYTIFFRAPGPPPVGLRRVAVSTTRPDVLVRARPQGYWAGE